MSSESKSLMPGWTRVRFGDVVKLNTDRCADPAAASIERYVGLEHIETEDLHIRRWGLVAEGTTFADLFRPGHVLFGKRRAYQRKVAVADFAGVCSSDIYVFESKNDHLLPELLPFICQTNGFTDYAIGTSAGSLSPRTNWERLAEYEFPLPPLQEQMRIAEIMRALIMYQDSLKTAEQQLRALKTSIIHNGSRTLSLAGIQRIGNLIGDIESGRSPNGLGMPAMDDEYGVLKVSAVGDWTFHENENKAVRSLDFASEWEVNPGDFLVTRANADPNSVGRTCLVDRTRPGLMLSDKTWRLVFSECNKFNRLGILAWTKSPIFRLYIHTHTGGTDARNISQQDFLEAPFPSCTSEKFNTFAIQIELVIQAEKALSRKIEKARSVAVNVFQGSGIGYYAGQE